MSKKISKPSLTKSAQQFLSELLAARGPSGHEQDVRLVWRNYLESAGIECQTDVMGNCRATLNPGGSPTVLLTGHLDEIGFQVSCINDEGFIHFTALGGHDVALLAGRAVEISTAKGLLPGVIGKKAIHVSTPEERKKTPELHELWIDIGAESRQQAEEYVQVGDFVTCQSPVRELLNNCWGGRACDDRAGAFVVAETLARLANSKSKLSACVVGVGTVQEEIGLRGAVTATYGVAPDIGIAVDVTHATDSPGMDKRRNGEVKLGAGPELARGGLVNPVLFERLRLAASKAGLPVQVVSAPGRMGNDAAAIQLSRAGVATAKIGLPLRYMHTPCEIMSLDDLASSVGLLVEFCRKLRPGQSFIPE